MSRSTHRSHAWSLNPSDSSAIANARVALALLRCIRRLPGSFSSHQFDDLGTLLAPVLEKHRAKVQSALNAHRKAQRSRGDIHLDVEPTDALDLHDRQVLETLGEGIARSTPAFKSLADQLDQYLAKFNARHTHPTDRNLTLLGEVLSLSAPEIAFFRLAAAVNLGSIERSMFAFIPSGARLRKAVETICEVGSVCAARMLAVGSPLQKSGLLNALVSGRPAHDLEDLLQLTPTGDRLLGIPYESAAEMASAVLSPLPRPEPGACLAWPHLEESTKLLSAALSEALRRRTKGFNVLLHGAPGTGKTAFVRQLVTNIGGTGFVVAHCSDQGNEATRADRLAHLQLSQCFAGQRDGAVLLLDEAEDIFQNDYHSPFMRAFGGPKESKSWMNDLLESNRHPVIWISNQVSHLDPAYLRRFSFCLEFPQTPYSLRRNIAQSTLSPLGCKPETIEAVAQDVSATPALLSTAARFADLVRENGADADAAVLTHLREHAKAQGNLAPTQLARRTQRFDERYLNLTGNVTPEALVQALQRNQSAAIVFSGPPGTGKTQFAAEIAQRLDRRLLIRTSSDINSMWFGQSEINVANMFRNCDPKSEILFLDEAEVLLGDRELAGHRVERSVTAEFLRWMETFEGTFVCATNHAKGLDGALMRRFTFRVEFQPLSTVQRLELYAEQVLGWRPNSGLPAPRPDAETSQRLARLDRLTPGDYANTGRRVRSLGLSADCWIVELEAEHAAKAASARVRMGFV